MQTARKKKGRERRGVFLLFSPTCDLHPTNAFGRFLFWVVRSHEKLYREVGKNHTPTIAIMSAFCYNYNEYKTKSRRLRQITLYLIKGESAL